MMMFVKFIQMRERVNHLIEMTMALFDWDSCLDLSAHYNFEIFIKYFQKANPSSPIC